MATNFSNKNISTIQLQGIDYHLKSIPFHATEEEWKLINYIPKQGETVVYDIDSKNQNLRFKTGDGFTQVKNLPFSLSTVQETQSQIDKAVAEKSRVEIIAQETSEFLPTLTIHQLTQEEYEQKIADGSFEQNVLYLTPDEEIDLSPYATEEYVNNKVAGMVDSAPETLDTLNELAKALGDDPNFATTVATNIGKKVDKVDGKGLSTNDYTTDEKNKLEQLSNFVGDAKVSDQINQAIANIDIPDEIYVQNDEPVDVEDGALWLDLNEEAKGDSLSAVLYINQGLTEEQQEQARKNIGAVSANDIVYVTPEMFGAKGDGVTDDREAIQATINAGMPVFLNGTYAVSTGMTGTTPEIYGNATIVVLNDIGNIFELPNTRKVSGLTFDCKNHGVNKCLSFPSVDDVEVSDIKIRNVYDMRSNMESTLICVNNAETATIRNIQIQNCYHIENKTIGDSNGNIVGIQVSNYSKSCFIDNVSVKELHNIDSSGNIIMEDSAGIYIYCRNKETSTFITHINGYNSGKRLIKAQCSGPVIVDEIYSYNDAEDMMVAVGIQSTESEEQTEYGTAIISNSFFENTVITSSATQHAIASSEKIQVNNCVFKMPGQFAFLNLGDLTITNCDIYGYGVLNNGRTLKMDSVSFTGRAVVDSTNQTKIETTEITNSSIHHVIIGEINSEFMNLLGQYARVACVSFDNSRSVSVASDKAFLSDLTFMNTERTDILYVTSPNANIRNVDIYHEGENLSRAVNIEEGASATIENVTTTGYNLSIVGKGNVALKRGIDLYRVYMPNFVQFTNIPEYVSTLPPQTQSKSGARLILDSDNKLYIFTNGVWKAQN